MTDQPHDPPAPPEPPEDADRSARQERGERSLLDRRKLLRGIATSVVLALAGLTILFFVTHTQKTVSALGRIRLPYLLVGLALVPLELWLGGLRSWLLLRRIQPGTPLWLAVKAYVANTFLAAVTPSQVGGGIAQIYVFRQAGVPLSRGVAVTVLAFMVTQIFFLISGAAALAATGGLAAGGLGKRLVIYGVCGVAAVLGGFVLAIWRPVTAGRALQGLGGLLEKVHERSGRRLRRFGGRAVGALQRYQASVTWLLRHQRPAVLLTLLATAVLYLVKYSIGYVVVLGVGVRAPYLQVIAIEAVLLAVIYFAPTPGGSGLAELGTGAFMSLVLPSYLLPLYTVLWRFLLVYVPAALGAAMMLRRLTREARA